jgi:hypothetical protein
MHKVLKLGRLHNLTIPCKLDLLDKNGQTCFIVRMWIVVLWKLWYHRTCPLKNYVQCYYIWNLLHPRSWFMASCVAILWRLISKYALFHIGKNGKQSKLSNILYKLCLALSNIEGKNLTWLSSVKGILNEYGLVYIWNTQTFQNIEWLKLDIKQTLSERSICTTLVIFNSKFTKSS